MRPYLERMRDAVDEGPECVGGGGVELVLAACGGLVGLVVSAVRDDNPHVELLVVDRGHCVVIRAPQSIVLTAATLRWHLGRTFGIPELRNMIITVAGLVDAGERELIRIHDGIPHARVPLGPARA